MFSFQSQTIRYAKKWESVTNNHGGGEGKSIETYPEELRY